MISYLTTTSTWRPERVPWKKKRIKEAELLFKALHKKKIVLISHFKWNLHLKIIKNSKINEHRTALLLWKFWVVVFHFYTIFPFPEG